MVIGISKKRNEDRRMLWIFHINTTVQISWSYKLITQEINSTLRVRWIWWALNLFFALGGFVLLFLIIIFTRLRNHKSIFDLLWCQLSTNQLWKYINYKLLEYFNLFHRYNSKIEKFFRSFICQPRKTIWNVFVGFCSFFSKCANADFMGNVQLLFFNWNSTTFLVSKSFRWYRFSIRKLYYPT